MTAWLDTLVQGILLGGLYALYATGLSLIFGIMRLVNLAHGDLIIFAAFLILALVSALGIDSVVAFALARPGHVRSSATACSTSSSTAPWAAISSRRYW